MFLSLVATQGPVGYTLGDLVSTSVAMAAALIPAISWLGRLFGLNPTIQNKLINPGIIYAALALGCAFTAASVHFGYIYPFSLQ